MRLARSVPDGQRNPIRLRVTRPSRGFVSCPPSVDMFLSPRPIKIHLSVFFASMHPAMQGAATASIFIHLAATFMLYTTLCGCGSEKDRAAWRNRTTMVARATWLLVGCYTIVFSIWLSIFTGEPPCPIDLMPENSGSYTGESGESGSETTETPMNRVCVDTTGFCGAFSNGDRLASNDGRGKEGDFFIIGEGMELYIACSLLLTGAALLLVYERSFESWYWGCQATRREMRLGALALKPGDQCVAIFNYSDENGCIKIGDVGIVNGHNTFTLPGPSFSSRRGAVATTGTAMERINCTFPAYNGAVNLQPGRAGGVKPVGDGVQIRPVSDGVHIRPVASHNGVNHGVRLDSTQVTIEIAPQPMNPNTPSATVRAAQRSPAAQALHTLLRAYYAEFAPGAKTDAALGKMAETIVWKGSMDAKDAKFKAKYGISLTEFRAAQQIDIPSRVTGNNAFDDTMAGFDDFDI